MLNNNTNRANRVQQPMQYKFECTLTTQMVNGRVIRSSNHWATDFGAALAGFCRAERLNQAEFTLNAQTANGLVETYTRNNGNFLKLTRES